MESTISGCMEYFSNITVPLLLYLSVNHYIFCILHISDIFNSTTYRYSLTIATEDIAQKKYNI